MAGQRGRKNRGTGDSTDGIPDGAAPKIQVWVTPTRSLRSKPSVSPPPPAAPLLATPQPDEQQGGAHHADNFDDDDDLDENPFDASDLPVRVLVGSTDCDWRWGCLSLGGWVAFWSAIAVLMGAGGWTAIQLIINPGSVKWVHRLVPQWGDAPLLSKGGGQSANEIRATLTPNGFVLGEAVKLGTLSEANTTDVLFPVYRETDDCQTSTDLLAQLSGDCFSMVELRVYRPVDVRKGEPTYQLLDRLAVKGPSESFVVAPLVLSPNDSHGSSAAVSFTDIGSVKGEPPDDQRVWLHLHGDRMWGSTRIVFGQVAYYDLSRSQLVLLNQWTSPVAQLPVWQEVTGQGQAELVVNQSVGLEPDFEVYQVKPATADAPLKLQAIPLTAPAIRQNTVETAIALAQSGLWSPAKQAMELFKQRQPSSWTISAQAQLDLITLHANVTQAQADRDWANPSQQITADVIDGRWAAAVALLEQTLTNGNDLTVFLKDQSGHLWQRVETTLRVNPNQADARAIGTFILAARQGRNSAVAWLQQQLQRTGVPVAAVQVDARTQRILNALDGVSIAAQPALHDSRFWGTATTVASIDADAWYTPERRSLTLPPGQTWYSVQIDGFHDGQRWQLSPFGGLSLTSLDRTHQLWERVGLGSEPQVQLMEWRDGVAQSRYASVAAVQFNDGALRLLVAGDTPPPDAPATPTLAIASRTLQWLDSAPQTWLSEMSLQQPELIAQVVPTVVSHAPQSVQMVATADTQMPLLQGLPDLPVQRIDLTGNGEPELVITLDPTQWVTASTPSSESGVPVSSLLPQTLIFSEQGSLIYQAGALGSASLLAIATLSGDPTPVLLTYENGHYRLRRWSANGGTFE